MSTAERSQGKLDPRQAYARPPFLRQGDLATPGETREMNPAPDHGEATYQGSGKLSGLSALVTGGDSGIGRAISLCFAREGANVAISLLDESEDARITQDLVEAAGVRSLALKGDIRSEACCDALVEQTISEFGQLDILVNNAAFQQTAETLDEFSTELFDRVFKTNVYAAFWLARAAMPFLAPGSSIINTVSIQAYDPSPELLPYAASKSALLGLTKALAKIAMEHGVRVNAVAPGPVWTPLIPATVPVEKYKTFVADTLLGRPAQPIELAPLFVWLASPEASYVTAEVFAATGGRTPY